MDPDETLPPPPDPPEPRIPEPNELAAHLLDRKHARARARVCRMAPARGQRPDELVGYVLDFAAAAGQGRASCRCGGPRGDRAARRRAAGSAPGRGARRPRELLVPRGRADRSADPRHARVARSLGHGATGPPRSLALGVRARDHARSSAASFATAGGSTSSSSWAGVCGLGVVPGAARPRSGQAAPSRRRASALGATKSCSSWTPSSPGQGHAAIGVPLDALGLAGRYAACACPQWTQSPGA